MATDTLEHLTAPSLRKIDPHEPVQLVVRPLETTQDPAPVSEADVATHWISRVSTALRQQFLPITIILLPMLVAAIYYLLLLSDQYIAETRFVIRSTTTTGLGGLSIMTQSQGLARTEDDTHLVNEFLQSRDAVMLLAKEDRLLDALKRPEGDIFYGFPTILSGSTKEDLYEHYRTFIDVSYKSATGITTLKVRAFTPDDAERLATALLTHGENVVNELNKRARADAVAFSKMVADAAERRVLAAQQKLANFRNRELMLDPGKQSAATLELLNKLLAEKLTLETTLTSTRAVTPDSPKIPGVLNRMAAIDQQINSLKAGLAGNKDAVASKLAEYEKLNLERELAAKSLTAALSSLENSRQEAARQQVYLERVVKPNRADKSQYPKRLQSLAMMFAICLALYWIVKSLADVVMAHDA